ncbi:DUF968 domain-containing protein [Zooshikella marina]|uniref:DUF968 domain-containing protein n=1 Tax=Zooshikella ganghwensis TaxID=202772 RepID=UPI001BAF14D1|nr:DUF968 domain-containing protein [Zooshikella ganghwensis]MBU2708848.1 DUF968 domain-containing protein [Zooshikella ganghwensis]
MHFDEPPALVFAVKRLQTMADGTPRVLVEFPHDDLATVAKYFSVDSIGAAARLSEEATRSYAQGKTIEAVSNGPFSKNAEILHKSFFFRTPAVWKAIGSDKAFLAWLRQQPCAICKRKAPSEAAHVRRVANGAGVGIKPEYSAIPLCHEHHSAQHQSGESAIGGVEKVDRLRLKYLAEWSSEALKQLLSVDHWYNCMPEDLRAWTIQNNIQQHLPVAYLRTYETTGVQR